MHAAPTAPQIGLCVAARRPRWHGLALSIGLSGCAHPAVGAPPPPVAAERDAMQQASGKLAALAPHFVRQQTQASCSVASSTVVINALLSARGMPPITQAAVLNSDASGAWRRETRESPAAEGVTLDALAGFLQTAIVAQGLRGVTVDTVHVLDEAPPTVHRLTDALVAAERHPANAFVIVNFLQSSLVADGAAVGHMSVVGTYDATRELVLILDVDPDIGPPYWVSLRQLVAAMHTGDDVTSQPRGYLTLRADAL